MSGCDFKNCSCEGKSPAVRSDEAKARYNARTAPAADFPHTYAGGTVPNEKLLEHAHEVDSVVRELQGTPSDSPAEGRAKAVAITSLQTASMWLRRAAFGQS